MGWLSRWRPKMDAPAPDGFETAFAQGRQYLQAGDYAAAAESFGRCVTLDSAHADAHVSLGFALFSQARNREAGVPLHRAVELAPANADARYLLGAVLLAEHDMAGAIQHLGEAARRQPDLVVAQRDLARALFETGQADEAEIVLRTAMVAAPLAADLHLFLGNVLLGSRRETEAIASYRAALAIDPANTSARSSLVPALLATGNVEDAATVARSALAAEPGLLTARSNLLLALSADGACTPQAYLAEAMQFERYCQPASRPLAARPSGGPLRVGFVSGDLRRHPVGYFLAPLLAHRDKSAVSFIAYNNHPRRDALTETLRQGFDLWREAWGLDDDALLAAIRSDRVDVLVDLSGHTPGNRLSVFARRAATIQVSWLGYWASTGLSAMDYFIADETAMAGDHAADFVEKVCRLPVSRLCFGAPDDTSLILPGPLPALRNRSFTFASFQRAAKIDDASLHLWARVLAAVPGARLRLQTAYFGVAEQRAGFQVRLRAHGIDPERVDFFGESPRIAYLAAHAEVDVILDTIVHTGATTTCEALWMGVPTLTLRGDRLLARQGASLLAAAGLTDWIADDEDAFVTRAREVAADLPALADLRAGLRTRVVGSPLMNGRRFARDFVALLEGLRD